MPSPPPRPEIAPAGSLAGALEQLPQEGTGFVLHPGEAATVRELDAGISSIVLAVGPEGGWSDAELKQLTAAGLVRLGFGPRVLRTETAGPAVIAALQAHVGDC